jgi:hypothetical protein
MPFQTLSNVPVDAKWSEITDSDITVNAGNMKVYELSWSETGVDGSARRRSLRIFTDSSKNLPYKIQTFSQIDSDPQLVTESVRIFEYPDDQEVLAKAKDMSF